MTAGSVLTVLLIFLTLGTQGSAHAAPPPLELQVDLDPVARQFKAVAFVPSPSREFRFDLHESLAVTAASVQDKPLSVTVDRRNGSTRTWRVIVPANAGRLRLEYGGTLPALDPNLDHRGVLQSLPPMVSPAGSFLPAGSAWYPQPATLFPYKVSLSLPADQRALVPGRLQSEALPTDAGGRYRATFEFSHPADGIDLMAGPWVVRELMAPQARGEPVRLRTYFFRDLDAIPGLADGYLADTRRYLELYSEQIGPYPFTEFSVVASPLPTGFGMPTLTYLGADVLKLPFIRATSLGHEVLHSWWGNGVYADYATGNWSEGLTTFMADYAYKERESASAAREMRLGWLRDFAAVPADSQQSLASFRSRTHGAAATVGYGKAAMVFVMLRDAVGEDTFRRSLRTFWEKYRFKVASWNDLKSTFQETSGRPLDTFFEQWLNRAGGPEPKIKDAATKSDAGKIRLILALAQPIPPYALHLPVEIVYPGHPETRWIDLEKSQETVTLQLDERPEGLRLDPELRVWRHLGPEQLPLILRQWIITPSPRLIVASSSPELREAAGNLASRLFENAPRIIPVDGLGQGTEPALLVGLHAEVDAVLDRAGLPPRPANLAGKGSAQVWTMAGRTGTPVAVVSVRDVDALRALLRPLPHYGSQSWLVFEGGRAIDRGVWPAPGRLIPVREER